MVNDTINPRQAQELLGVVEEARKALRPVLSPTWITYAMMCVASAHYPLMTYSFHRAGLAFWIPALVLGAAFVAAMIFMGVALSMMIRHRGKTVRGFSKRWAVMMLMWGVAYTSSGLLITSSNVDTVSMELLVGVSFLFIVMSIVGPLWEMTAQAREQRAIGQR